MASTPTELLQLPKGVLYHVLSLLPPNSLAEICRSNAQLSNICLEQEFWNFKHYTHFGQAPKIPKKNQLLFSPPPSLTYYQEYLAYMNAQISDLRHQYNSEIFDLLMSSVQPEDEPNVQNISQFVSNKLSQDVETCLQQNVSVSECFDSFNIWLTYMMKGGSLIRGRIPPPERLKKFLESRIDSTRQIKLDHKSGQDPYQALSRAVFDLVLEQEYAIMDLENETKHVNKLVSRILESQYKQVMLSK